MELKKIGIGVMINDNDAGEVAMMPAAEVDELVALYNKALPALYDKAMNAFMEEYNTRMSC